MQNLLKKLNSPPGIWILTIVGFYVLLLGVAWFPTADVDVTMYLAIARRALSEGRFPEFDPFIFSIENYRWHIMHQWLGYFPWYAAYKVFGESGLVMLKLVVIIMIFTLPVVLATTFKNHSWSSALIMALALGAATLRLSERTSLFSDFFQCLTVAIVAVGFNGRPKILRTLPLIFFVWANLHPGFHPGLFIFGIAVICFGRWPIDENTRESIIIFIFCILGSLFNPRGIAGFMYPLRTVFSNQWDIMRIYNLEWFPTFSETFRGTFAVGCWSFMMISVIATSIWSKAALAGPLKRTWYWFIFTSIFLFAYGSYSTRFISASSYTLMTLMVAWISIVKKKNTIPNRNMSFAVAGALLFLGLWSLAFGTHINGISRNPGSGFDKRVFPVEAARWYQTHQQKSGNIWNDHAFGSYLAFTWDGSPKIYYHGFMDDMIFYGSNYMNIYQTRSEFDRIVSEFNIKTFFIRSWDLSKPNAPLLYSILKNHSAFQMVYSDNVAMIFIRP